MRLGLSVGYWGLGLSNEDQLELVVAAEELDYHSVWTAEAYGSDAATVLGWLAGKTSKIKLGSAIFQMPGRSPAMTAMTAATLDVISGGRMLLGLGSSGPQVAEGWHGERFGHQLQRTREYVAIVRMALARERVKFEGERYLLEGPHVSVAVSARAGCNVVSWNTLTGLHRTTGAGCVRSARPSTESRLDCSRNCQIATIALKIHSA